jgi:hypothetical protein
MRSGKRLSGPNELSLASPRSNSSPLAGEFVRFAGQKKAAPYSFRFSPPPQAAGRIGREQKSRRFFVAI